MAFVASTQTRLLTGPFALSAYSTKVATSMKRATIDRTAFTDTSFVHIPGMKSHDLTVDTMFDSDVTAGGYYSTLTGFFTNGTQVPVSVAPKGFTAGNEVWVGDAWQVSAGVNSATADGVNMPLTFAVSGPALYGQSLSDLTAYTSTTSTSAVDGSAASTNGGIAHLHVTAVSGTGGPTCDVIVEHSVNGSTSWATLATFTQVTTAVSGQSVTVAAGTAVRRYLRITATIAGTNPSFTLAVAFARA